jgi:hypothetical protein
VGQTMNNATIKIGKRNIKAGRAHVHADQITKLGIKVEYTRTATTT